MTEPEDARSTPLSPSPAEGGQATPSTSTTESRPDFFNEDVDPPGGGLNTVGLSPSEYFDESGRGVLAAPDDSPTGLQIQKEKHMREMQKYVVFGIGGLFALSLLAVTVLALIRPELQDVVSNMSQLLFGGLVGLGGSIVGYLFADRRGG